ELRAWLLLVAAALGDYHLFVRYGVPLLEQLERDSGLLDYRELAAEPAESRVTQALTRLQQRYDATPVAARSLAPLAAIQALARASGAFINMAQLAHDHAIVQRVPSLVPLLPLSPALSLLQRMVESTLAFQSGRHEQAQQHWLEVLALLD